MDVLCSFHPIVTVIIDQLLEEAKFYYKNKHLYYHEKLVRLMAYNFLKNKCTVKPPAFDEGTPDAHGLNESIVQVAEVSVCNNYYSENAQYAVFL